MSDPTPEGQIAALQEQLIKLRKRGDRAESPQDNRPVECEILGNLGIAYYRGQQWYEAVATLTEYLNLAQELGNQWHQAVAQYYLGFTQEFLGEDWLAVQAFCQAYWLWRLFNQDEFCSQVWQQVNQALDRYVNAKDSEKLRGILAWQLQVADAWKDAGLKGEILGNIGRIQYNNKAFQEAVISYSEMLEIAEALQDDCRKSFALAWLGCSYRELGDLAKALEYFDRRLVVAQELGDRAAQKETLGWLIDISKRSEKFDRTVEYYQVQLGLFRELKELILEYNCLYELARFQFNSQKYQEALSGFESALQLAETLDEDSSKTYKIASDRYMLGDCYRNLGQQEPAISWYEQAVGLYVELKETQWALSGLDYLVNLYRELKQDEQVIASYQRQLEIFRETGDRVSEYSCLYELARFQFNIQQYQEALSGFESALQIAESLDEDTGKIYKIANSRYMLGRCYGNLKQPETAISWYEQAVGLYVEVKETKWALSGLEYLVNLYRELKQDERVISSYQRQLEIFRETGDRVAEYSCLYDLAMFQFNTQQYQEALSGFEAALQIGESLDEDSQKNYKIANSQYMLGRCYGNLKQPETAISWYEQAVELYVEVKETKWALSGLEYLVNLHRELKQDERVISSYQRQLEIFRETGDRISEYSSLYDLAMFQFNTQQYQDALSGFEAALQLAETLDEDSQKSYKIANSQYMLGRCYEKLEQFHNAVENYELSRKSYRKVNDIKWMAAASHCLANIYLYDYPLEKAESIEQAIEIFQDNLTAYSRETYPQDWAKTQNALGTAYFKRICGDKAENLETAIRHYEAALAVYTREAYPQDWAMVQVNLGGTYRNRIEEEKLENWHRAIACYEAALQVRTREAEPKKWASLQNRLGNIYSDDVPGDKAENLETAIGYYNAALEVYTREAYPQDWAMVQVNLGGTYRNRIEGDKLDNWYRAIACYEAALQVRTREAEPKKWASLQNRLGNIYSDDVPGDKAENLETAIACYEAALEVYTREAYPEDWARTQNNLGIAYEKRIRGNKADNLEKAIAYYNAALEIRTREAYPEDWARTQNNLGIAYQAQSQNYTSNPAKKQIALENAYNAFEQALDTVEYLRGEIASGDEVKRKLNEEWNGLYLGVEYLRGEIASGDEVKRKFNEEWNRLYLGMVEVCLELGRDTDAIEYVDRSKARNLTELIATRDAYPGGEIPADIRQRLQQLRLEIAEEDRRLKQDPDPDYGHITQLREEFQVKYPYKPLAFQDIQSLLDDETAILEWYILGDKFLTFTITPNPPLTPPLEGGEPEPPFQRGAGGISLWQSSPEDFKTLIDWGNAYLNDYRNNKTQWQNNLPQRLETLSQILHLDEILHNLRETFPTCKKLILIPHRFLHLFPIHALPVSNPQEGASIVSLQELFPNGVSYSPNCQVLQQAQKRQQKRPDFNQLFAIQNPTKDLNFTDIEVEAIKNFFDPHHVLKHDEAEKTALDFHNAHCTHFSCHGYFNFEDALKSALILAKSEFAPPPPSEDQSRYIPLRNGKLLDLSKCLTIEDILRLDLTSCRLVTLSACETGITDFTSTSDEYIGLPSGFIMAGSPNVVSTLWTVNDLSSALLMIRFYQNLKNGETVPLALKHAQIWLRDATAEALQQWSSQLKLRSTYRQQLRRFSKMESTAKPFSSPYYWAGFCAIGA